MDVVVLEVGIGGRLDSTNIIPRAIATAVTTLDYDHVELLGETLTLIAAEKAGIFRPQVPAFTCDQDPEAMQSLEASATKVCLRMSVRVCMRGGGCGELGGAAPLVALVWPCWHAFFIQT